MKKLFFALFLMVSVASVSKAQTVVPDDIKALMNKNTCTACHKADTKLVGPSFKEIMKKKKYKPEQIVALIYNPKPKNWPGYTAMAALPMVPKDEALKIATWITTLK